MDSIMVRLFQTISAYFNIWTLIDIIDFVVTSFFWLPFNDPFSSVTPKEAEPVEYFSQLSATNEDCLIFYWRQILKIRFSNTWWGIHKYGLRGNISTPQYLQYPGNPSAQGVVILHPCFYMWLYFNKWRVFLQLEPHQIW
jgi:hypothetical protein